MSFRCNGPIRGDCLVEHPTLADAVAHVEQDHLLQSQPGGLGFTDREPFDSGTSDKYEVYTNAGTEPAIAKEKTKFADLAKADEIVNEQTFEGVGTWKKPLGKTIVYLYSGALNKMILQNTQLASTLGASEPISKPVGGTLRFGGTNVVSNSITIISI